MKLPDAYRLLFDLKELYADAEKKAIQTVKREGIINHKTPIYKTLVTYKGTK